MPERGKKRQKRDSRGTEEKANRAEENNLQSNVEAVKFVEKNQVAVQMPLQTLATLKPALQGLIFFFYFF